MGSFLLAFEPALYVFHFSTAILLIIMILLQSGKGSDIGAAFGAGGSQSLFGARGAATLLSKITTVFAMIFLITSLSLTTTSKYTAALGAGESIVKEQLTEGDTDTDKVEQLEDYGDQTGIPVN